MLSKKKYSLFKVNKRPKLGLTIAGGGTRTLFALGVGKVLIENGFEFSSVTATSAGCAVAMAMFSGNVEKSIEDFIYTVAENKSNFYFKELLKGRRPFPHEQMYRNIIRNSIDMEKIRSLDIDIIFNAIKLPPHLYPDDKPLLRHQVLLKLIKALYDEFNNTKKGIYTPLLPTVVKKLGLKEEVFYINNQTDSEEAIDIVLLASSAPPLLSFQRKVGQAYYLDGSFIDNLPLANHRRQLDLIIAIYYELSSRELTTVIGRDAHPNIFYIYPKKPVSISMFDYTNPQGIRDTYEMGLEQGENIMRLLKSFM